MKKFTLISAITVAALGFSSMAFAERDGDFPALDAQRPVQQVPGARGVPQQTGPQGYNHPDARNDRRVEARGPQFRQGGTMPREYRTRQYVVNDWRGHSLSAPPRGYNWVQVGADYALVAVATGLIAQLVLDH